MLPGTCEAGWPVARTYKAGWPVARNLRSRWQNKAWGASPRFRSKKGDRARGAGDSAVARFTGSIEYCMANLGLAPQALCCHLLRRFRAQDPLRYLLRRL